VKDKLIFLAIFAIGGVVLYSFCAPDAWRGRKNWDTQRTYAEPGPAPSGGKQVMSEQYIYKNEGGRTVKYRETWSRSK
jgi:hypothetical protein